MSGKVQRPPPPISAYARGTFAHFTIERRLPKILSDVTAQLDENDRRDPRWLALRAAMLAGSEIDTDLFAADTVYWREKLEAWGAAGTRWSDLPFFDLEFLFYHAVDSIAGDLRPGFDVFVSARQAALADALPGVAATLDALGTDSISLDAALLLAASGNEADLSQLTRAESSATPDSMLVDERPRIRDQLARAGSGAAGTIQLLVDNAGSELCFDLVLADVLLAVGADRVEMQLKPRPMFVSDALIADAEETIDRCCREGGRKLAAIGGRLRAATGEGRLVLRASADWAEPRHMNGLSADLAAALREATVVLAKGDLNYRRFFEDRSWPAETPVSVASVASSMCAFALRVLKSDSVVGLAPSQVASLFATDESWRSNGKYRLIQRVDKEGDA